jgi:hypothetical protein
MAHITIQYMILIPLLILQIFLLPYVASIMMGYWSTSSEAIALQDATSNISSSIQQLYFFLSDTLVSPGTITSNLNVPEYIGNYAYVGNATLVSVSGSNSGKLLQITLTLMGSKISTASTVATGQNVQWINSTFMSNSTNPCINGYKDSNNTIWLSFKT